MPGLRIPEVEFITRYRAMSASGFSPEKIAQDLGVELASLERRIARMRKRGIDVDAPAPVPDGLADLDQVAETAHILSMAIREFDPIDLHNMLASQCASSPLRMAQVIMALAAWVDPDESASVRDARVAQAVAYRAA